MLTKIDKVFQEKLNHNHFLDTIELFQKGLFLVAFLEIVLRCQNIEVLYSDYNLILQNSEVEFLRGLFSTLASLNNKLITYSSLVLYGLTLVINFTKYRNFLTKLLSWYLCGSINYFNSSIGDGGSGVMLILMFYSIFLSNGQKEWQRVLNNTVLFLIKTQVCFIYLNAGLLKVTGELWTKGVATYYTLQVDQFSHPFIQETIAKNAVFVTLSSLGTLAFQLTFPLMVWNKKTRNLFIFIGSLIHLQIAFVMGLTTFGLIMSVSYIVFYDNTKSQEILKVKNHLKWNGQPLKMSPLGSYS